MLGADVVATEETEAKTKAPEEEAGVVTPAGLTVMEWVVLSTVIQTVHRPLPSVFSTITPPLTVS